MCHVSIFRPLRDDEILPVRTHHVVLEGTSTNPNDNLENCGKHRNDVQNKGKHKQEMKEKHLRRHRKEKKVTDFLQT